jgi:hypothetical protein
MKRLASESDTSVKERNMMRENRGKFICGMSLVGLLLLTSAAIAQKKQASPAPTSSAPAAKMAAPVAIPAPVVTDGRIVQIESSDPNARLSPESTAKVQAAFNRRLPRDLRTYTLGEVISAAEAAFAEGSPAESSTAKTSAPKQRHCVDITFHCCPPKITATRYPC